MRSIHFITTQIQEIKSCQSLLIYGFFLSLTHILTFFFWHNYITIHQYLTKSAQAICWPFMPFCSAFRLTSPLLAEILLFAYLSLSVLTAFLFLYSSWLKKRALPKGKISSGAKGLRASPKLQGLHFFTSWAFCLFAFLTLVKFYMFFMDFRLMGNYHYMPFLVSLAYLFVRGKTFFIPLLIVCFYVFAGLLKISNQDWLTGLAFAQNIEFPLFVNEQVKQGLCFYVLCLELIGSWFLILKGGWVRNVFFIQFVIFHIMSWFIVGWFYPLIMLCLLSLFPLSRGSNKISVTGLVFLLFVIVGNMLSVFIPGRAGLTGEGRLYGLNMYDAHTECDSQIFVKFYIQRNPNRYKIIQESFSGYNEYALRIHCDPYIDYSTVQKLCTYYKEDPDFVDIDWFLHSKLRSDLAYTKIVSETNICAKNLKYSAWRKNSWIKPNG